MAYIPNSFGAAIGVTDQQIIDAFSKNNPDLQANIQEYMRTYGLTNADLLGMVKHYAPEAKLDLNQVMSYTQMPNQEQAQAFSAVPGAQSGPGQLAQFGQGLLAQKPQGGLLGNGIPPQVAPQPMPERPTGFAPQPTQERPIGYSPQDMNPRPASYNPAPSMLNAAVGGRSYQGGHSFGGAAGTAARNPSRVLPDGYTQPAIPGRPTGYTPQPMEGRPTGYVKSKEDQLRSIFGGIRR